MLQMSPVWSLLPSVPYFCHSCFHHCGSSCHAGYSFIRYLWCEYWLVQTITRIRCLKSFPVRTWGLALIHWASLLRSITNNRTWICVSPSLITVCQSILTAAVTLQWLKVVVIVLEHASGIISPLPAFTPLRNVFRDLTDSFQSAGWLKLNRHEH